MWPLVTGVFHLACRFQGSSAWQHVSPFHSFIWLNNTPLYRYFAFDLFITWWTLGLLNHFLAILNHAAVNICVRVFVWICVFIYLGYISRSELLGHKESMFNFLRNFLSFLNCIFIVHFEAYISAALSTFTLLCNHPILHFQNFFHVAQLKLCTH